MKTSTRSEPIENYALLADTRTVALVSKAGSVDWYCPARIDSPACFAAILGTEEHGRWSLEPKAEVKRVTRRYLGNSLVLETLFETESGTAAVIDYMPIAKVPRASAIVRVVEGRSGTVPFGMELIIRFAYGKVIPWVVRTDTGLIAMAGRDRLALHADVPLGGQDYRTFSRFSVQAGQRIPLRLSYTQAYDAVPNGDPHEGELDDTLNWWEVWAARGKIDRTSPYAGDILASLKVLKGLIFEPSGGIAAAATASLPEELGGERNWDYRYCWLRDSSLILDAFLRAGYHDEAVAYRDWLVRAAAGMPSQLQVLFGVGGERYAPEIELKHLPGYENSRPVRVGNAAQDQFQLDNYGQVLDFMHLARRAGLPASAEAWRVETALVKHVDKVWRQPDYGIWEIRGEPRHFVHSKLMAWVAADRAVRAVEAYGQPGPRERWRSLRDSIRADILTNGVSAKRGCFTQTYGGEELDAALLLIPALGFLPPTDPRVLATIEAVRQDLCEDGFVLRYRTSSGVDGLKGHEGTFLICSFWLVDALQMAGRPEEACELFERLLALRNDVGLLAEEWDPRLQRQLGNFPQAFSHVGLVHSAQRLSEKRYAAVRPNNA